MLLSFTDTTKYAGILKLNTRYFCRAANVLNQCFGIFVALSEWAGWQVWEPGHQWFLNGKQACSCLSELAYISQAEPETKGLETKGGSCYPVSLQPPGRKCGQWGMCRPALEGS